MAPPISRLVDRIFNAYDANKNGVIDRKSENCYTYTATYAFRDELVTSSTTYSHAKLFAAADKNQDGKVTKRELTDVLKRFDTDKDGWLDSRGVYLFDEPREYQHFKKAFPQEVVNQTRTTRPAR